jgi:hypothetical protein
MNDGEVGRRAAEYAESRRNPKPHLGVAELLGTVMGPAAYYDRSNKR